MPRPGRYELLVYALVPAFFFAVQVCAQEPALTSFERAPAAKATIAESNRKPGAESASAAGYTINADVGLQFVPVVPCRVADTRSPAGAFGGPALSGGATREFDVPSSGCGIPSNAAAYSLNVTVVPAGALGYLTLWPTGQTQPNVSTLNSDGRVKANAAITEAGTSGGVNVFVSDASNVILDIDGYFVPAGTTGTIAPLAFFPVTPCRVADTRGVVGPLGGPSIGAGASRNFPVQSSACSIPATAQAYSLNVTAVPHKTLNYLTSWPTGQPQPYVSTLNSSTGAVAANAAIVPAGGSGDVSIFVSDDADVILDVNGYFAPPATGGLSLYAVPPCRVIDTRDSSGEVDGRLPVGVETSACAPPSTAQAYVLNATVVPPGPLNYLTLWPDGQAQPYVSTLNADDGAVTSNLAIVPTSDGKVDVFSSNPTEVILDLSSYFAPTAPAAFGGSNYGWYYLAAPCNREPYGVVYNYDTATATINAQLQQMYQNGQRRLRIPIFFGRGIDTGTVMDSTGGNLAPRFLANLANLLAAIKAAGFVEIEVSFHPQGDNDPNQGQPFSSDYFQENWSLIQNLHSIIAGAGIPYHIDLLNEGIPPASSTYAGLLEYDQMLWNDYVPMFGSSDTIGFSIIADSGHLGQVSTVYGPSQYGSHGSPPVFDVHIYDETGNSFATAVSFLSSQGYQAVPWIIGEAYYNDAAEATSLRQQAVSTGQSVLYLTQWPVTSDGTCSTAVNVAPPADFSNYQAQQF